MVKDKQTSLTTPDARDLANFHGDSPLGSQDSVVELLLRPCGRLLRSDIIVAPYYVGVD